MRSDKTNQKTAKWLPAAALILIAAAGLFVHISILEPAKIIEGQDVYYTYIEGERIIQGENPYARVLEGDFRENDKYATYFPLAYLLSGLTQLLGFKGFVSWLLVWRIAFMAANLGIATLIFLIAKQQKQVFLGIFGAAFWLFNRWTLHVTAISQIDFIPLFLLLLSLVFIPRRFYLACLIFGVSLAFKQVAIFALPLYLVWSWQNSQQHRVRQLIVTTLLIGAIPFLLSVPFLVWNFEGFFRSILFSVTRYAADHFSAPALGEFFGLVGMVAEIPMLLLLGMAYVLALVKQVPKYASILLVMIIFFGFNSVLFRQYVIWFMPFIPLAVLEILPAKK